jgi:hypothetical protein
MDRSGKTAALDRGEKLVAPLAECGRCPHEGHRAGLKKLAQEQRVNRRVGAGPGISRRRGGDHQGVHGDQLPPGGDDQGVDVHFADVRSFHGQPREPQKGRDGLPAVHRGLAAEGTQQGAGADFVQHLGRIGCRQRRHPEDHVGQGLGQDAPQPEHHHRAELGVLDHTRHQLPAAEDLALHQQAFQVRARRGLQGAGGGKHLVRRPEVEVHQVALAFVQQPFPQPLEDHGKPQGPSGPRGRFGRSRSGLANHRDVVGCQQRFGRILAHCRLGRHRV